MENNNNLPSTISGDGRKFISLLKNYLTDISDVVNDIYTVLGIDESTVLDIDEYIKNVKITEKKVGGNVTLEVSWNKDDIVQYAGVNILVKEKEEYYTGNWEETEVTRTYNTGKVTQFTLENISVGYSYQITVLGRNIKGATSKIDSSPAVEYYVSPNDHTPLLPYDFTVVFDKRGVYWSWKQRDNSETQWTELRLDENAGMEYNRLDITTGLYSNAIPTVRVGKAYLYNKGIGNAYTQPLIIDYTKPIPSAPQNVTVIPVFEGLTISFDAIPENCLGAKVYINNEPHQITTNHFTYLCSTGEYTIKVCYTDVFGEGEMSQPVIESTVEEIPPNAVHVTDKTVFDDGVIVAKYIGDKAVVGTKIADGVITTDKLVANAITSDKIAANAITSDKINTGEITADKIATGTITGDKLSADTITGDKIVAGTISGDKIAANSISGDKIQAGSIDADKMNVDKLSSITANIGDLTGGTITGGTIVGGTITGANILNNSGTFSVDDSGNINGVNIQSGSINADVIRQAGFRVFRVSIHKFTVGCYQNIPLPSGGSWDNCIPVYVCPTGGFHYSSYSYPEGYLKSKYNSSISLPSEGMFGGITPDNQVYSFSRSVVHDDGYSYYGYTSDSIVYVIQLHTYDM